MDVLKKDEANPVVVHNEHAQVRQPTDLRDVNTINKARFNFIEIFDRPEFGGRIQEPLLRRDETIRRDSNNEVMCSTVMPTRGRVSDAFIKRIKLP